MSNSHIQQPVWHPDQMMKRRDNLGRRAEMIRAIREYFWEQDFIECETPALQTSPGLEPHLQAFKTDFVGMDRFGASAPAEELFERFGFTAENVAQKAKALL